MVADSSGAGHGARLAELVADAVARGGLARTMIVEEIVPVLPPGERAFAEGVARRLTTEHLFDTALWRDLDTLMAVVGRHMRRGCPERYGLSENEGDQGQGAAAAGALSVALLDLRDLARGINRVRRMLADRTPSPAASAAAVME